jgi:hypothetical protein
MPPEPRQLGAGPAAGTPPWDRTPGRCRDAPVCWRSRSVDASTQGADGGPASPEFVAGHARICHATASEDAMPDPPSRIRRKLDCLKPISRRTQTSVHRNTPQPVRKEMIDPFYERTPMSLLARTSPTASPPWSPARATAASASYGPCPQNSSDRIRAPGAFSSDGGSPSGDGDRCLWIRRTSTRSQPVNSRPSYGTSRCLFPTRHIGDRDPPRIDTKRSRELSLQPARSGRKLRDDATAAGLTSSS